MNKELEIALQKYSEVKRRTDELRKNLAQIPAYSELDACEKALVELKKDIMNQSTESYEVSVNDTTFKFTKYVSKVFDTRLFKLEQPELASKYVKVLTKKVLSVKQVWQ